MSSDSIPLDQSLEDFLRFTGNTAVTTAQTPVFILVLGMTSSGKSTLVQHCTGSDAEVGHGLRSCTNNVSVHSFTHPDFPHHHVHLIDTPSFDDTQLSPITTLKTIASYLSASFANGIRMNGILYLHRISDNPLGHSALQNLRMFKKLTGLGTWPSTLIGTTMWKTGEFAEGERRERELVGNWDWFGDMLSRGAKAMRIAEHGTGVDEQKHSALRIISYLLSRLEINPTIELDIQRELVVENKSLNETSAGKEALGEIYYLQRQLERQLQGARRDMQEAVSQRDADAAKQIRMVEEDCEGKIGEAKREQEKLTMSLTEMHEEEMERVLRRLDKSEKQQKVVLMKKRRELEDMEKSVRLMREQSKVDTERWEKRCLDIVAMQEKRRVNEEVERESEQNLVVMRRELAREEAQVQSIGKARGVMKQNLVNGMVNGAASAAMTTVGAAVLGGLMCVVS